MSVSVLEPSNTANATVVEYHNATDVTSGLTLTVKDRCDACGAQAHNIAVSGTTGNRLQLCNHHARKCEAGLLKQGFTLEKHHYSFKSGIKDIPPAEKR